eukprot:2165259-Rhodomonas_salina.4
MQEDRKVKAETDTERVRVRGCRKSESQRARAKSERRERARKSKTTHTHTHKHTKNAPSVFDNQAQPTNIADHTERGWRGRKDRALHQGVEGELEYGAEDEAAQEVLLRDAKAVGQDRRLGLRDRPEQDGAECEPEAGERAEEEEDGVG